jgi:hypothetical protein
LHNRQSSEYIAIKFNSPDGNFKPKIPPRVFEALDSIKESQAGTHCLMVYPDLVTLRAIYSQYIKIQLEYNNEIVLVLPYYETPDTVRLVLSGRNGYDYDSSTNPFEYSGIDVSKYEKEGSLMIIDSLKGYFPPEGQSSYYSHDDNNNNNNNIRGGLDFMSFIYILLKQAERRRKDGVTVLADLGSFYHHHKHGNQKLIEYEKSLPKKYDSMNLKGFCLYHQKDFDSQFRLEQQAELIDCHSRNIMLVNT